MTYTPAGPWTNGAPPGADQNFFNNLETFLQSVNSVATDTSVSSASGVLHVINAILTGGKIGKSTVGDILDASTTTTKLNATTQISLQIGGTTVGFVTTSGLDFTGSFVTTDKIRLPVGSLTHIKLFTGTGSGSFTHGLGAAPDFVSVMGNNTTAAFGYNNPTSSTVGINASSAVGWVAIAFALN